MKEVNSYVKNNLFRETDFFGTIILRCFFTNSTFWEFDIIYCYYRRHFVTKNIRTLNKNITYSIHALLIKCSNHLINLAQRHLIVLKYVYISYRLQYSIEIIFHVFVMDRNWTLKGHRAKSWLFVALRPPKGTSTD
jgi:hypothetical protein